MNKNGANSTDSGHCAHRRFQHRDPPCSGFSTISARRPPAWDDLLEPLPDWDTLAPPAPEFEFDQRISW
ncbi:MAG: hypothetical protein EHM71_16975 [Zetaproteobacteria bacterium]|nr:MAG: hypothetical protein EHM71_16975 [Zetaproteobacteria bacterium]